MQLTRESVRRRARIPLTLPIRVVCRESADYQWNVRSRLVDVSQFGAGFTLTRPIEVGRLIQLVIPLPNQLRCFDHNEPMYSVWGLVRHSALLRKDLQGSAVYRVGVGFVGKYPPPSYRADPTIRYELLTNGKHSMSQLGVRANANQRRETRLTVPLEVLVEALDENGQPLIQEYTVTETLSSLGACIPTNLEVEVGRVLRLSSVSDRVTIFAVIRSRQIGSDGVARLGLEFIGERWPLQGTETVAPLL